MRVEEVREGVRVVVPDMGCRGVVIRVNRERQLYWICWDGNHVPLEFQLSDGDETLTLPQLRLLCKHCDLPKDDHADNGKCLYLPTNWEAPW